MTPADKKTTAIDRIRLNAEIITFLAEKLDGKMISLEGAQHALRLISDDIWAAYAVHDGIEP